VRLPGYTAERSVYDSTGRYASVVAGAPASGGAVVPAIFCDFACAGREIESHVICRATARAPTAVPTSRRRLEGSVEGRARLSRSRTGFSTCSSSSAPRFEAAESVGR
jgi:hypothetical protein